MNIQKIIDLRRRLSLYYSTSGAEINYFVPEMGSNIIRVLPTQSDIPFKELGWHFISSSKRFLCPLILTGDECPICEAVEVLRESKVASDRELARKWSVQVKGAFNIYDRRDGKVKVWIASPKIYRLILDLIAEWEQSYPNCPYFIDPYRGRDFNLRVSPGKHKKGGETITQYELLVLDQRPIHDDPKEVEKILSQVYDLDEIFKAMDYERLKELFESSGVQEDVMMQNGSNMYPCYGKDYDATDSDCQNCSLRDECRQKQAQEQKVDEQKVQEQKQVQSQPQSHDDIQHSVQRSTQKKSGVDISEILSKYKRDGRK